MPCVMTKCPQTDKIVSTVVRMKPAEFESFSGSRSFRCPSCEQIHTWTKDQAWLAAS